MGLQTLTTKPTRIATSNPMDTRVVLVVTGVDRTADAVVNELYGRGVPVARFNLADFATDTALTVHLDESPVFRGVFETPSRRVELDQVRSVYYRRPTYPELTDLSEADGAFVTDQIRYGFHGVLQTLPGCLYVNHPRRVAAAEWKPAQLQLAAQLGFEVPATIITNRVAEVVAFAKASGPIVYKTVSWSPYEVDDEARTVWVREVDPAELDESIARTAHLFQARLTRWPMCGSPWSAGRSSVQGFPRRWWTGERTTTSSTTTRLSIRRQGLSTN